MFLTRISFQLRENIASVHGSVGFAVFLAISFYPFARVLMCPRTFLLKIPDISRKFKMD